MLSWLKLSRDPGGSRDILAKSLANPDMIFKKEKYIYFYKFCLDLYSDLAKKSGHPPWGYTDNFSQDNIAGSHDTLNCMIGRKGGWRRGARKSTLEDICPHYVKIHSGGPVQLFRHSRQRFTENKS